MAFVNANLSQKNRLYVALQLAPLNVDVNDLINNHILDKIDVGYHTFLRVWQVVENVWLNQTSSDRDRADSTFNAERTHIAIPILSFVPATIGFLLYWHQMENNRKFQTIAYQQKKIAEARKKLGEIAALEHDEETYRNILQGLLNSKKIALAANIKATEEETKNAATKKNKTLVGRTIDTIYAGYKATWSFLVQSALLFWPAWMIAALVVGFAASYALPVLPIVVLAAFAGAAVIKGILYWMQKRQAKKIQQLNQAVGAEVEETAKETNRMLAIKSRLLQRAYTKEVHAYTKSVFAAQYRKLFPSIQKAENQPVYYTTTHENIIALVKNEALPPANQPEEEEVVLPTNAELRQKIMQSRIGERFLDDKHTHRSHLASETTLSFIQQYTLSAFVCWIVGAAFLGIGLATGLLPALAGATIVFLFIANLILGATLPGIAALFNVLNGLFGSKNSYQAIQARHKHCVETAYVQFTAPYKPNNQRWTNAIEVWLTEQKDSRKPSSREQGVISQQDAFDYFLQRVERQKVKIAHSLQLAQTVIKNKLKTQPLSALSEEERVIHNFNLANINVYNDRYFRKFENAPSLWTKIKKAVFRSYRSTNAAQTGIFIARSLFLVGTALAFVSLLAGPFAPIAFIGIAATIALIAVIARLATMYFSKKAANKQFFVDTLPDRISYLKKQTKALELVG